MGVVSVTIGAVLVFLSIGSLYSEGNISTYVVSYMRIHREALDVNNGHQIWFLSASLGLVGPFMIVGGYLMEKFSVTSCVLLGGGILTAGMFLCTWAVQLGSLGVVVIFCAVCTGVGTGLIYSTLLQVLMNWMPKRKGLASGILVGAMTLGSAIHSTLQGQLMNPLGEELVGFVNGQLQCSGLKTEDFNRCCADATGGGQCELYFVQDSVLTRVPEFFWKVGLIHLCLQLIGAMLIRLPREGEVSDAEGHNELMITNPVQATRADEPLMIKVEATWSEMLRTRPFWCLYAIFFCNGHIVTFIVASCKHLGSDLFEITDDNFLTWLLATTWFFNGFGRFGFGAVGDYFGYKKTMLGLSVVLTFFIGTLSLGALSHGAAWEKPVFFLWICIISFCMGGNFSNIPALTVQYFGMEHFVMNFGFVWSGVSSSAILSGVSSAVLYSTIGAVGFVILTAMFGVLSIVAVLYLPPVDEFHKEFIKHRAESAPLLADGNPQC